MRRARQLITELRAIQAAGLTPALVRDRIRCGWPKEALLLPKGSRNPLIARKPDAPYIAQKAKEAGLDPNTVYKRIKSGTTEALWYAPVGTLDVKPARRRIPQDPELWASLESDRLRLGISMAAVSKSIGHQAAWYSQQLAAQRVLTPDIVAKIQALFAMVAKNRIKAATPLL